MEAQEHEKELERLLKREHSAGALPKDNPIRQRHDGLVIALDNKNNDMNFILPKYDLN